MSHLFYFIFSEIFLRFLFPSISKCILYLDWPGGDEEDPVPLEVLDGVGVAGMVEEGQAGVDGAADCLHPETLKARFVDIPSFTWPWDYMILTVLNGLFS